MLNVPGEYLFFQVASIAEKETPSLIYEKKQATKGLHSESPSK